MLNIKEVCFFALTHNSDLSCQIIVLYLSIQLVDTKPKTQNSMTEKI